MSSLLRDAVLLDTETLGLRRGAAMHELAILDLDSRKLRSFVLSPNEVDVKAATPQERTRLSGAYADVYTRNKSATSWLKAVQEMLRKDAGVEPAKALPELRAQLKEHLPWFARQIDKHPHLMGEIESEASLEARKQKLAAQGIEATLGQKTTIQSILRHELPEAIRGKTVWIANAPFEAKQLGAQLGAEQQAGYAWSQDWKRKVALETFSPGSPDPFYVTGAEVSRARVIAQRTGDWTGVYAAYKKYTPKAGETAVRDIQDVIRAVHSYGHKLGFTSADHAYMGTSVDVSHKLLSMVFDPDRLKSVGAEAHRAAEDLGHESYVLRRSVEMADILQEVQEDTELGREYKAQARAGKGPLALLGKYFGALEAHAPALMQEQLTKRLGRAAQDIAEQGFTHQTIGRSTYKVKAETASGGQVTEYRSKPQLKRLTTMDEVVELLEAEKRYSTYGASPRETWAGISAEVEAGDRTLPRIIDDRVQSLKASMSGDLAGDPRRALRGATADPATRAAVQTAQAIAEMRLARPLAVAAGAIMGLGAVASVFQDKPERTQNITTYGYREWVEKRRIEGMSQGRINSDMRHQMTDFGSPYRGMTGVENVFIDQELLAEREKFLRSQYGARHYDPAYGAIDPFQGFRFTSGYTYFTGGDRVDASQFGLRGNLMAFDLSQGGWKLTAEDADTVVLKRGGVRGAVSSFFGLNRGYSFRLAGIDSPETSHGAQSYHAPQPGAENSAYALKMLMAGAENLTLVYDPSETTYGRMMGAVIADGKNVNFQLVQRGFAAHLPFGKWQDSIIDYTSLGEHEALAYEARRGIWRTPWARTFYEHAEGSDNRITFNTLARKDRIAENRGTMQLISLMEENQRNASFSERDSITARQMGESYTIGADKVGPLLMSAPTRPSHSYLTEQMSDASDFIRTKGRGGKHNKFSSRGNYGTLDRRLAIDTLQTSNSIWTKRRYASFDTYNSSKALAATRKHTMAMQQRQALRTMQQSPIGHTRM